MAGTTKYAHLGPFDRRAIKIIGYTSVLLAVLLTVSGVMVFLTHESDPNWFNHVRDGPRPRGSTTAEGLAAFHSSIADVATLLVLIATAFAAFRIMYDLPLLGVVAFVVVLTGHVTGSLIRFNAVKIEGFPLESADRGYLQVFGRDFEYMATNRYDLGPVATWIYTLMHLLTMPILLGSVIYTYWLSVRPDPAKALRRVRYPLPTQPAIGQDPPT